MYLIAKQFSFSASHRLDGLDPSHPCGRDHGHNYTVRVALAADELDNTRCGTVAEIASWVRTQDVDLVVVTGGEPMLQQEALRCLAELCSPARVQVETNGTRIPNASLGTVVDLFVVSPKLANSGVARHRRIVPAALWALAATGSVAWKFVAVSPADLDEIDALVTAYGLVPVWVMPEGTTEHQILDRARTLVDPVLDRGWHFSLRLHTLLWGDHRGR